MSKETIRIDECRTGPVAVEYNVEMGNKRLRSVVHPDGDVYQDYYVINGDICTHVSPDEAWSPMLVALNHHRHGVERSDVIVTYSQPKVYQ